MTPASGPRFVLRGGAEGDTSLDSVEALQERIASGAVPPDAQLFDASTGRWSPARDVPVFLFILEELEAEGRLPDALRPLVAPSASGSDEEGADGSGPAADESAVADPPDVLDDGDPVGPVEPDEPGGADADEPPHVEDPFALRMDLVDLPESGGSPGERRPSALDSDPGSDLPSESLQGDADGPPEPGEPAEAPVAADEGVDAAESVDAATEPGNETEPPDDEGRPEGFTLDPLEDFSLAALEPLDRDEPAERTPEPPAGAGDDENWFTPAAEGGMVLGPDADEVVQWEPEDDDGPGTAGAPGRSGPAFRTKVAVPLVLVGLAGLSWAILSGAPEAGESFTEVVAAPQPEVPVVPPVPDDLGSQGVRVVAQVDRAFRSAVDSVRGDLALAGSPPPAWLSGYYLANAAEFPGVVTFWERYGELLQRMRVVDAEVYRGAVDAALAREALQDADRARLRGYFADRYRRQADYRQRRYDDLAETARAAIRLHEVLARHQAEIAFSPALGRGVSADPILEAVIPEGAVRVDVDRALDQVFQALDRTRRGGPPSADGLRTELFGGFGDPF